MGVSDSEEQNGAMAETTAPSASSASSPVGNIALSAEDLERLRVTLLVASSSRVNGNHPFGSVLTDAAGTVVLEAENTVVTDRDATGHAETNLVRLASHRYTPDELAEFTLYTSCEPCAMCSGAIYWAGIGRVVFALAESELYAITGANEENPTMRLPCREVFAAGQRETVVAGPALDLRAEATAVHHDFWV